MKIQQIIPILLLAGFCTVNAQTNSTPAESKSIKLDSNGIPFGTLGYPVGTYLTIEGVKTKKSFPMQPDYLLVDTVNGSKLSEPTPIVFTTWSGWAEEAVNWPDDRRVIFKGFEKFEIAGEPPALEQAYKESGHELPTLRIQQPAWRVVHSFVVTYVVPQKEVTK